MFHFFLSHLRLLRGLRRSVFWLGFGLGTLSVGVGAPSAQPCTVIHVDGSVWTASTSRSHSEAAVDPVDVGTKLSPIDTLGFDSANDRALALCPNKGRLVFRPQQSPAGSVWFAVVADVIADPYRPRDLGARGTPLPDTLRTLHDLHLHFGVPRYLMLGAYDVPVANPLRRQLETGGRLLLTSADDAETRELKIDAGHLHLSPDTLMHVIRRTVREKESDKAFVPTALLRWAAGDDSQFLAAVHPVVPPPDRVAREVRTLERVLKEQNVSPADIREEIYDFLQEVYGTPYHPHADAWLATIRTGP